MTTEPTKYAKPGSQRWLLGMAIATFFSLVYLVTPVYVLGCLISFLVLPLKTALFISIPMILSICIPPIHSPRITSMLRPMLDYFEYEEYFEFTDEEVHKALQEGKKFMVCFQPHGVLSFVGFCAKANVSPELSFIHTAVASVLMKFPILKNVMGIFGLIDASKSSMQRHFRTAGAQACLVLYVGGIAELFKSSRKQERLFLSKRKGFIKMALRDGIDVAPAYLFGNTSALTVWKHGFLAWLSRKAQVSLTYYWGRFYLPIPRNDKLLYARGRPLGLPHIPEPTDDDVNKWHAKYCEEVTRLFDKYKEKVPVYKHKTLFID